MKRLVLRVKKKPGKETHIRESRPIQETHTNAKTNGVAMIWKAPLKCRSLLQNIVSFIGLFCTRDACF